MKHSGEKCEEWRLFETTTQLSVVRAASSTWRGCPWCLKPLQRDVRDLKRGDRIMYLGAEGVRIFRAMEGEWVSYWKAREDGTWVEDRTFVDNLIVMPPLPEVD